TTVSLSWSAAPRDWFERSLPTLSETWACLGWLAIAAIAGVSPGIPPAAPKHRISTRVLSINDKRCIVFREGCHRRAAAAERPMPGSRSPDYALPLTQTVLKVLVVINIVSGVLVLLLLPMSFVWEPQLVSNFHTKWPSVDGLLLLNRLRVLVLIGLP